MKIGNVEFEIDSSKIRETDTELVIPGTIAREAVLQYPQGRAYRPKDELRESFLTFDGAFVVSGKHPEQMLVTRPRRSAAKSRIPPGTRRKAKLPLTLCSSKSGMFRSSSRTSRVAD